MYLIENMGRRGVYQYSSLTPYWNGFHFCWRNPSTWTSNS